MVENDHIQRNRTLTRNYQAVDQNINLFQTWKLREKGTKVMLKNNRLLNSVHKMQVFLFSFLALMATFVSLNTRGLRSPDRWRTAFSIFRRSRFDLICLQETHWTAELEMEIKRDWDGEVFVSHGN